MKNGKMLAIGAFLFAVSATCAMDAVAKDVSVLDCPACSTEAQYAAAAEHEVWSNPNTSAPPNQQYTQSVVVTGAHLDRIYVANYDTLMESEGPFIFYTPIRRSLVRVDLGDPVTDKDTLYVGAQVAAYVESGGFALTLPAPATFDAQGNHDSNLVWVNGNPLVTIESAITAGLARGGAYRLSQILRTSEFTREAIGLLGSVSVPIYIKLQHPDGSYAYYKVSGSVRSSLRVEEVVIVRSDGTVKVISAEDMKFLPKTEEEIQEWLEDPANAEHASLVGLTAPARYIAIRGSLRFGNVVIQIHDPEVPNCWPIPDGVACRKKDGA